MREALMSLFGGVCIGLAVSLMLFFNGRVTGVSGIVNGVLTPQKDDTLWRVVFVLGLVTGGFVLFLSRPESFVDTTQSAWPQVVVAGLLVGFGTVMGSGCTSGHGVCGISRMSIRSIIATLAFMGAGIVSVLIFKTLTGASL